MMGNLKNKQKYAPHHQIQLIEPRQNVHNVGRERCADNVCVKGFEGNEQLGDTEDEEDLTFLAQKLKNENTSIFDNTIIGFDKLNCLLKNNHVKELKRQLLWNTSRVPFPF